MCTSEETCNPATNHCDPVCAGAQPDAPWPMVGRCASRRSLSPHVGAQTNHVKWSVAAPGFGGNDLTGITIDANGTIYAGTGEGVHAFLPDGTLKWKSDKYWVFHPPLIGADGTVYASSYGDYVLRAMSPADGAVKWTFSQFGNEYSEPALRSDGAIIGAFDALYAVAPDDGHKLWRVDGTDTDASPSIGADGTVYMTAPIPGGFAALDAITLDGSFAFKGAIPGQAWLGTPVIGPNGTMYVGENHKVFALSFDGTPLWTSDLSAYNEGFGVVGIGPDDTLYVAAGMAAGLYALSAIDGSLKWQFVPGGGGLSLPAIGADGTVYVTLGSVLHALRPDGTQLWAFSQGGACGPPAIGADGTTYAFCADSKLYAFGP